MVRIGVTGLMASGKSTVSRRFQERGAELVEGDSLGWEVLRRPPVRDAIAASFGPAVLDREGAVDLDGSLQRRRRLFQMSGLAKREPELLL